MALNKQEIPISFSGGIDTKTDDKQVDSTKLLELENAVFTSKGKLQKRFGNDLLSQTTTDNLTISAATGISTFKDELISFDGTNIYSFLESSQLWKPKGKSTSVVSSIKQITRDPSTKTVVDYAFSNGLGVYVFEDSILGCSYTVIDEISGAVIIPSTTLNLTAQLPKVVAVGQYFVIFYVLGANLYFRQMTVTDPEVLSPEATLYVDVHATNKLYDVCIINGSAYLAYNTNTNQISTSYITPALVLSFNVLIADLATNAITISTDSSSNVWVSWATAAAVKSHVYDSTLSANVLPTPTTTIDTVANVRNLTVIETDPLESTFIYEISNTVGLLPANFLKSNSLSTVGILGTPIVKLRGHGLASKAFEYNGAQYITVTNQSDLQSSYYVYNLNGDIISKFQSGVGGGYTVKSVLPAAVKISAGKVIIPHLQRGELLVEIGKLFAALGISSATLDFISLSNFISAEFADSLHIVGGTLQSYDGVSITETGFNLFPEYVSAVEVPSGSGFTTANTDLYQYSVVYAWIDNNGLIHRSAPSVPTEVTVAAFPSNFTLTIPTLRLTKKDNVFIEVYRTERNGTLFYKVTSTLSPLMNNKTVDTVSFTDTTSDTPNGGALISGEFLYTNSGELENIAPPSSSVICVWKNRLIVKSSDEENVLWYSKIRNPGFPVQFSDSFKIIVDQHGGDITAIKALDDKLIIFKNHTMYVQSGDGPNNLGEQSDFGLPQRIASDVGCSDVNSVVEVPEGLIFKSHKGIYRLDRSLLVKYIGYEVEKYNANSITAAQTIPDVNQIRFTTADNVCLVYDYFFSQWSTFTNHEAVGAAIYLDKFTFIKSNGQVFKQNDDRFDDASQSVKLRLVTSWIQLAGIQGFQRFYKCLILGDYKSKHRLKVKVGYDFNKVFTQEVILNPFSIINPVAYGDSSPYGAEEVYGGRYRKYQWRINPKLQKCESFRLSIEDIHDDVFGESMSLSALLLEIGTKQGTNKLIVDQSFGTE